MSKKPDIDKAGTEGNCDACVDIFKCFFDNSIVGQCMISPDGGIRANKAFSNMLGYTEEELLNKHWCDITFPVDIEASQKNIDRLISGEKAAIHLIKRYVRKDEAIFWAEVHGTLCRCLPDGKPKLLTTIIDVSDSLFAKLKADESNKMFSRFVNASEDLIFLKDDKFRYIAANKALADFYGVKVEDLIGKTYYETIAFGTDEKCCETDAEALRKNAPVVFFETVKDRILETRKFPVPIRDGKTGVGAYFRDVTETVNRQEIINKMSETNRIVTECMLKPFKDIQEQLDYALHEALKLTGSQYGYIYFYDESKEEFTLNSWTLGVMDDCAVLEKNTKYMLEKTGIWGEVVRQRKAIVINDFQKPNPLKKGHPEGHVALQKYMSIPIYDNDKIVAVIGFANKKADYSQNDVQLITVLMTGVWIATKKREQERETQILLERTQAMINTHEAVMLLIDPFSGEIIEANHSAVSFYGYSREELLGMNIGDINQLPAEEVIKLRAQVLNSGQKYFTFPHKLKNGEIRMVDVYSSPIEYNNQKVLFSIIFDVTKRETVTKQNEYLAYHDYLTGAYNRRFFDEEFARINTESNFPVAIILGDINGLKTFNDSFGHLDGDKAIKEISGRIASAVGPGGVFARVGGDEFVILMAKTDEEQVKKQLQLIDAAVNTTNDNVDKRYLSASFGYGVQRNEGDGLDELMQEAEAFMYNRKYYNARSMRSNTVNVIMNTLFEKSEREKNHSERVGLICEAIAKKLGWEDRYVDRMRVAGFLHDIGKIGIGEDILSKKGKLEKIEWEIMKLHPSKGARILGNTFEFKDIADIVLSHHEHYIGSGYPKGLKGEEIPIEARIISVADAYDAMTNERTYRQAISKEEAAAELIACSATQFDPDIVAVFVNEVLPDRSFAGEAIPVGSRYTEGISKGT